MQRQVNLPTRSLLRTTGGWSYLRTRPRCIAGNSWTKSGQGEGSWRWSQEVLSEHSMDTWAASQEHISSLVLRYEGRRHCSTRESCGCIENELMVLRWKNALRADYFPYQHSAGGAVLSLEHAHCTFKALTRELPISGWVSRACAKHQAIHRTTLIPMLVAKEGDTVTTRPCPLIYYMNSCWKTWST